MGDWSNSAGARIDDDVGVGVGVVPGVGVGVGVTPGVGVGVGVIPGDGSVPFPAANRAATDTCCSSRSKRAWTCWSSSTQHMQFLIDTHLQRHFEALTLFITTSGGALGAARPQPKPATTVCRSGQ